MNDNVHPIDPLLAELMPGVRRVTSADSLRLAQDEPLKVHVLFPCVITQGAPTMWALDLNLFFEPGGVTLDCPSYMPLDVQAVVRPALRQINPEPQPLYAVGAERCKCPPGKGGPRWNPLCVALVWQPDLEATLPQLATRWFGKLRTHQQQFCIDGVFLLRAMGVA